MLVLLKETEMANLTPEGALRAAALCDEFETAARQVREAEGQLKIAQENKKTLEREREQVYGDLGFKFKPKTSQQPETPEPEISPQAEERPFSFDDEERNKEGVEKNKHKITVWREKRPLIVAGVAAVIVALLCLLIFLFISKTETSEIFVGKVAVLSEKIKSVAGQVTGIRQEVGVIGETALRIEIQNKNLKSDVAEIKKGISSKPPSPTPASKKVPATKAAGNGTGVQNSSSELCYLKVADERDQRKVLGFVVVKEVEGKIHLSKYYVLSKTSPSQGTKHTTWQGKGNCVSNKTLVRERWSNVISDLGLFFESKPL